MRRYFEDISLSEANAGYLAGIIDGEGSIMICSQIDRRHALKGRGRYYYVQVNVFNTYKPLLDWIESVTGRGNTYRDRSARSILETKPGWVWCARGWSAADVLRAVEPYLMEKRQKALVALEFAEVRHRVHINGKRELSDEEVAEYQRLYDKHKAL